jgi:hypothetical protein
VQYTRRRECWHRIAAGANASQCLRIQDKYNSAPLISNKTTFARAFLEAVKPEDVGKRISGQLRGFDARTHSELTGSPLQPFTAGTLESAPPRSIAKGCRFNASLSVAHSLKGTMKPEPVKIGHCEWFPGRSSSFLEFNRSRFGDRV